MMGKILDFLWIVFLSILQVCGIVMAVGLLVFIFAIVSGRPEIYTVTLVFVNQIPVWFQNSLMCGAILYVVRKRWNDKENR